MIMANISIDLLLPITHFPYHFLQLTFTANAVGAAVTIHCTRLPHALEACETGAGGAAIGDAAICQDTPPSGLAPHARLLSDGQSTACCVIQRLRLRNGQ